MHDISAQLACARLDAAAESCAEDSFLCHGFVEARLECDRDAGVDSLQSSLERLAEEKRATLRRPEYDPPCQVAPGLFIGGVGAARDLEALQALGVTHVVNASPIVPCFHRRKLRYKSLLVYDDETEDIAQFFDVANAFIAKGRRKGGVLVHCYAGQSRSSTLVVAYLVSREKLLLEEALHTLKIARPCACPNAGFLRQLDAYAAVVHQPEEHAPELAPLDAAMAAGGDS